MGQGLESAGGLKPGASGPHFCLQELLLPESGAAVCPPASWTRPEGPAAICTVPSLL